MWSHWFTSMRAHRLYLSLTPRHATDHPPPPHPPPIFVHISVLFCVRRRRRRRLSFVRSVVRSSVFKCMCSGEVFETLFQHINKNDRLVSDANQFAGPNLNNMWYVIFSLKAKTTKSVFSDVSFKKMCRLPPYLLCLLWISLNNGKKEDNIEGINCRHWHS